MVNIYTTLDQIFDKFNRTFSDALGGMIERDSFVFTLQRKTNVICKAKYQSFENTNGDFKHEIAINPEYLSVKPKIEILKSLCQELLLLYRYHHGDPETRQIDLYDEEWGEFMMVMGLMPSNTGKPDGKETGKKMSSYIMSGKGYFVLLCEELAEQGLLIDWFDKVPKKYEVDNIMADLYDYKENYDLDDWDNRLLEVPVLQRQGVDIISLIASLGVDDTSRKIEIQGEIKKTPVAPKLTTEDILDLIDEEIKDGSTLDLSESKASIDAQDCDGVISNNQEVESISDGLHEHEVDEDALSDDHKTFSSTFNDDVPIRTTADAKSIIEKRLGDDAFAAPKQKKNKEVISSKEEIAILIGIDPDKPEPRKRTVFQYKCGCGIEITAKSPTYSITCDKCEMKFKPVDVDYEVGVALN
ncbi:hypothetical protein A7M79_00710 [Acinetobacter baumannii]|nr:hypothetical protein A7M79_00710 [Acinetobacter baumannii]